MSRARKLAAVGMLALLALQFIWHGLLAPPGSPPGWLVALLFSLPLMPSLLLLIAGKRSAIFWAGVAALFYFCHGITEAWAVAQARPLALLELVLSVGIIVAGSWDGMSARFSKRNKASTNV